MVGRSRNGGILNPDVYSAVPSEVEIVVQLVVQMKMDRVVFLKSPEGFALGNSRYRLWGWVTLRTHFFGGVAHPHRLGDLFFLLTTTIRSMTTVGLVGCPHSVPSIGFPGAGIAPIHLFMSELLSKTVKPGS